MCDNRIRLVCKSGLNDQNDADSPNPRSTRTHSTEIDCGMQTAIWDLGVSKVL